MKTTTPSHLDELLALRPAPDAPSSYVQTAIAGITAKGKEYLARVAKLEEQRPAALLARSGADILAMDQEIALLKIGGEQAAALVPALMDQHKTQRRAEWITGLQAQREELINHLEDFASRFHAFYGSAADEFLRLLEEAEAVAAASKNFNRTLTRAENESGIIPVQEVPAEAISQAYRYRTALPAVGMAFGKFSDDFLYKGRGLEIVDHNPGGVGQVAILGAEIRNLQRRLAEAEAKLAGREPALAR